MSRHKPAGKQGLHPVSANEQYLLVFLFIAHHQQVFRPRRRVLNAPRGNNRVSVVPGPASKQGPSVPSPPFPPTLRISSRPPWIETRGSRLPLGDGPGGQASASTDGRAAPCGSNLPAVRAPPLRQGAWRVFRRSFGGANPRQQEGPRCTSAAGAARLPEPATGAPHPAERSTWARAVQTPTRREAAAVPRLAGRRWCGFSAMDEMIKCVVRLAPAA